MLFDDDACFCDCSELQFGMNCSFVTVWYILILSFVSLLGFWLFLREFCCFGCWNGFTGFLVLTGLMMGWFCGLFCLLQFSFNSLDLDSFDGYVCWNGFTRWRIFWTELQVLLCLMEDGSFDTWFFLFLKFLSFIQCSPPFAWAFSLLYLDCFFDSLWAE